MRQATDYQPKKWPGQARSRLTFDAILEATARILEERGYVGLTTNAVAERAGVGIASVYEYFPHRDAIVATLAERRLAGSIERIAADIPALRATTPGEAIAHMLESALREMVAQAALYRVLLREVPFVPQLPAVLRLQERAFAHARSLAESFETTLALADFDADIWLLWQMVYNTILEIAFAELDEQRRAELLAELTRLILRMTGRPSRESPPD